MTIATNAFSTYSQIGIKENVSKIITNITPDETPAYSTLPKFTVKDRLYQWQTDTLATPASNAQLEGDVISASATTATVMLNNRTQISYKSLSVTDTSRTVSTYGREDEYDYQIMKRGRELKTDVEIGLLKNVAKDVGSAGTARVCGGLPTYISNVAYGTAPTAADGSTVAAAGASTVLTYAMLSSAMTLAYVAGGSPTLMMLPPVLKKRFSSLAFSSTPSTADVRYNLDKPKAAVAIGTVETWLSDFGTVEVAPNRQMARSGDSFLGGAIYLIDKSKARVGILQDTEVVPLAKRGLADEAFIRIEFTLEVTAPASHAGVYGVT